MKGSAIILVGLFFLETGCTRADSRAAENPQNEVPQRQAASQPSNPCSQDVALLLAHSVILAAPIVISDDLYLNNGAPLHALVQSQPALFRKDGAVTRCAALVGPRVVKSGIELYDSKAYETVMAGAPPEVAEHAVAVARSFNEQSANLLELGQEISWLSDVLPAVAANDMGPFSNTGNELRLYKKRVAAIALESLRASCQMDPQFCQYLVASLTTQWKPMVDEIAVATAYTLTMLAR